MSDVWVKFALRILVEFVSKWLTPELIDEGKAKLVAFLRKLAKDKTPDFPIDDELVELIAKALQVP